MPDDIVDIDDADDLENDDLDEGYDIDDEEDEDEIDEDELSEPIFVVSYYAKRWAEDGAVETRYTEQGQAYYNVDEYGNPIEEGENEEEPTS